VLHAGTGWLTSECSSVGARSTNAAAAATAATATATAAFGGRGELLGGSRSEHGAWSSELGTHRGVQRCRGFWSRRILCTPAVVWHSGRECGRPAPCNFPPLCCCCCFLCGTVRRNPGARGVRSQSRKESEGVRRSPAIPPVDLLWPPVAPPEKTLSGRADRGETRIDRER
ncbi:hypothetical protein NDU88_002834, partial [Pleurodeles waltl]